MEGTANAGVLSWEYALLIWGTAKGQCDWNVSGGLMMEGKLVGAEVREATGHGETPLLTVFGSRYCSQAFSCRLGEGSPGGSQTALFQVT